jgi:hypothetical protein
MHVHHQRSMLQEIWLQGNSEMVFKWVTGHVLQQGPSPQLMLTKSLGDNHCNLGKLFVTIKNRESLTKIWSTLCLSSKKEMQPSGHEKLVWVKPSSSQGTNSLVLHTIESPGKAQRWLARRLKHCSKYKESLKALEKFPCMQIKSNLNRRITKPLLWQNLQFIWKGFMKLPRVVSSSWWRWVMPRRAQAWSCTNKIIIIWPKACTV